MSGYVVGPIKTAGWVDLISNAISQGTVTSGTSLRARFLGTIIDEESFSGGRDNLPPAINTPDQQIEEVPRSKTITPIGVLLSLGLALALVGVIFVLVRLRRRRTQLLRQEAIMATRSHDQEFEGDFRIETTDRYTPDTSEGPLASPPGDFNNHYTFDVGNMMKSELMEIHGHRRQGSSSKGLDESDLSESDVDSWAQTDATLGSIEHRLEPITAEV
uniref:Uncharacterized protein n=1 Tax=Cyclophora tenuis TaxID=216820 RepID=A0A7S1GG99_CYCTE|mmetsp:Transcript_11575/g.19594  ORF Transcript_11575/g.19594 Transcript_11575/m.19594 type:complete len:217 (+) Transcript_11575:218-868(+)